MLAAPSNLQASAVDEHKINLSWENNDEYGFIHIERKPTGGSFAEIDKIGGSNTSYQSTGMNDGTEYVFRIRAWKNGEFFEYSDYSNEASAVTFLHPPTACEGECIDADSAIIYWEDNSQNEIEFELWIKVGTSWEPMYYPGKNVEQYQVDGLTTGHTYTFKVLAANSKTASAFSNECTVKIVDPPAAPTNLTLIPQSSSIIRLNWQDNSDNETGFKIYESTNGSDFSYIDVVGPGVTTYLRTGRTSNTHYWYKVRAYNEYGNSGYSNTADGWTFAAISTPSNLVAIPFSDTKIEVTFQDCSDEEDDHRLERKPDGGAYVEIATLPPNVTFYRDSGLTKGQKYWYKVRAKQGANYSAYSNEDDATTISEPSAPTALAISEIGVDFMVLTWVKTSGETGYKIEKSTNGTDYTEIAVIGAGLERFKVFELSASTQYWFKIRAYNAAGNSGYTSAVNNTTLAQYAESKLGLLLRKPQPPLIFLCEVNPKMEVSGFGLTSGKAYTYEVTLEERGARVSSVLENGAAYTEKSSIADVESNASTFYFDYYGQKLYIHTSTGGDPVDFQILAGFWLYFTDYQTGASPLTFNDNNYLGLLRRDGIPDISHEISRYYEGNFAVASGRLSFHNAKIGGEWYFDKRYARYIWENAKLVLKAGGQGFAYSDYKTIATYSVKDREITDAAFALDVRDMRENCERNLPVNNFSTDVYPNLDTSLSGDSSISFLFGTKANVVPLCVDTVNKKFKLHDGRIKSVTSVKRMDGTTLVADTDYFVDYQNGIITLAKGLSWNTGDMLLVEFTGAVNSADEVIENGAEIFKYICNIFLGLADSELDLDLIYYTKYKKTMALSPLIYEDTSSRDIIRGIEQSIQAYSYQDRYGCIGLKPEATSAGVDVRYIRNHQIFSHTQGKKFDDAFYEVTVYYNKNPKTGYHQWVKQYLGAASWKYRTAQRLDIYTYLPTTAAAQTLLNDIISKIDKETISAEVSLLLLNVMPGDIIKYSRDRFFDEAGAASEMDLRILSIAASPANAKTSFTAEAI